MKNLWAVLDKLTDAEVEVVEFDDDGPYSKPVDPDEIAEITHAYYGAWITALLGVTRAIGRD